MVHTIVAMVGSEVAKVRCNTCDGSHRYRKGTPEAKAQTPAKRRKRAAAKVAGPSVDRIRERFRKRLAAVDTSEAQSYSPRLNPVRGDVIRHVKFGLGIVERVADGKASLTFEVGEKLLVVGR